MNEVERNIPVEAIQELNSSGEMKNLRIRQAALVWGMRGIGLLGLLQIKDQMQEDFLSVTLPFDDLRVYTIAVVSSTMVLGSGYVRGHFERQKQAKRTNAINRKIQSLDVDALADYAPGELPEDHLSQYREDVERAIRIAESLKKHI